MSSVFRTSLNSLPPLAFLASFKSRSLNGTMRTAALTASDVVAGQVELCILNGGRIDFGPGASVLNVLNMKDPSDYSAIQLSCHRPQINARRLVTYMFEKLQKPLNLSRIHVITVPDACPVAAHVQSRIRILPHAVRANSTFLKV